MRREREIAEKERVERSAVREGVRVEKECEYGKSAGREGVRVEKECE